MGDGGHFWAASFERNGEFGGRGLPPAMADSLTRLRHKAARPGDSTTIGIVATDLALTKAQAKRLAVMAHDGFARALWPSHTPLDGDLVFALATGGAPTGAPVDMIELGALASACVARAIARGVYEATPAPGDLVPTWRDRFGR
jgi:L-aminopeptidase/D-esterase-like protein